MNGDDFLGEYLSHENFCFLNAISICGDQRLWILYNKDFNTKMTHEEFKTTKK